MRRRYRRRSTLSWSIWTCALLGIAIVMAWQFEWWPGDNSVIDTNATTLLKSGDDHPPAEYKSREKGKRDPSDSEVLNGQSEPDDTEPAFITHARRTGRTSAAAPFPTEAAKPQPGSKVPARIDPPPRTTASKPPASQPPASQPPASQPPASQPPASQPPGSLTTAEFKGDRRRAALQPSAGKAPHTADADGPSPAQLAAIDRQLRDGDPREFLNAHKQLSKFYWEHPEWRDAIRRRIEYSARQIYFSPRPDFIPPYAFQSGDLPGKVARRYKVPWPYLERLNGVTATRIQAGQKLKVLKGPFSAIVDLSDRELTVHHYGYFVRRYRVGIGKDGRTPLGTFKVKEKLTDPRYYGTDDRTGRRYIIEKDDPRNPLGERWIGIGNSYGIHGTIDPTSIGRAESKGCIRLHNKDVAELYDLLGTGSEVVIQP